jgi:hypothetical protein
MSKQISNEEEFKANLKKLGELYEEGKDKLTSLWGACNGSPFPEDKGHHERLYAILQEMRDLSAVQMQHKHWINEN